jgi:hypothetical protein
MDPRLKTYLFNSGSVLEVEEAVQKESMHMLPPVDRT